MGYGPVNVPGVNALTMPWENTDIWHGLSDHKNAIATLANLIRWNKWDADAAIAAPRTADTAFSAALQTELAALKAEDTGFASDIAELKAADAAHTSNIATLQGAATDANSRLIALEFAAKMTAVHAGQLDRILMEERHTVTLSNNLAFPFNSTVNTPETIALDKVRDNAEYSVEAEILSRNGPIGELEVMAKARNGFKISFSGSGKNVTILLKVKGGMS